MQDHLSPDCGGPEDEAQKERKELVRRAIAGDREACERLLGPYRPRLAYALSLRLCSDEIRVNEVVEEALQEAARRLADYLKDRPLPLYPWLRQLALKELEVSQAGRNGKNRVRSPREVPRRFPPLSPRTVPYLVSQLLFGAGGPVQQSVSEEAVAAVSAVILRLHEIDREILILRHLEQLSNREAAAVVGLPERKVKFRHLRALTKVSQALDKALGNK